MSDSSRKLGRGYSLALNTGKNTHITLVYFNQCKRGYEQNYVNKAAQKYLIDEGYEEIELKYGDKWGKRSVHVTGDIKEIQYKLIKYFLDQGWDVDDRPRAHTPHVDLRGNSVDDLKQSVNINTDWAWQN